MLSNATMRSMRTRKKTERRKVMSAKRAVIEQKFKKMEAEAKRLGVTLLTKPEAFIDDDHLDCTWYGCC